MRERERERDSLSRAQRERERCRCAARHSISCERLTHRPTFFLNSSLLSLHSFCNQTHSEYVSTSKLLDNIIAQFGIPAWWVRRYRELISIVQGMGGCAAGGFWTKNKHMCQKRGRSVHLRKKTFLKTGFVSAGWHNDSRIGHVLSRYIFQG